MSNVTVATCACPTGAAAGGARPCVTYCRTLALFAPDATPAAVALCCEIEAVALAHCCCDPSCPHGREDACVIRCSTVALFFPPLFPDGSSFWSILHVCDSAAG